MTLANTAFNPGDQRPALPALPSPSSPLARLLDALDPNSALLIVRADTPAAADWITESRLERTIGRALLGPTEVDIWALAPDCQAIALRFPTGSGSVMRSLEVHTLRQFFVRELTNEWSMQNGEPAPFSVMPIAPLSHLENLQDNISELNSLLEILVNHQLKPQFQPIVNLRDGRVLGYETLIRGPKDALLKRPGQMFRVADKARVVAWFDLACMEECLKNAAAQQIRHLLFVNMDAEGLSAMGMQERPMALRAREHGLTPDNIVIEITERQMVADFPRLIEDIKRLREQGFQIAIDDAGAGYSSLRAVAELRPDFVKIDRDLVKNIDVAGERHALLAALSQYARSVGASVIAEGAESREELAALINLGIPYAQGYVLGKPSDTLRGTPREMREYIQERVEVREMQRASSDIAVGKLARPGFKADGATPLSDAARRFVKDPGLTSIAVIEQEQVRGLLLRHQLDHVLTLVKAARAAEMMPAETVAQWMRTDILRVVADAPVLQVVQQVITRQNLALDADVLILDAAGGYQGVVSVRSLMESVASQPIRKARYADPLTGMPGLVPLEREMRTRLDTQVSLGVIRLDISHLADLNDQYGLDHGDDLILALADLIKSCSHQCGSRSDFAAHMGGDNFLLLTGAPEAQNVCRALVEGFGQIAQTAAQSGGDTSRDRLPPCTLAVVAVTNRNRRLQTLQQITNGLQDLMRQAKSQPGSRYVIDGRSGA